MKNTKKTAAAAEEVKEAVRTVETKAEEEVKKAVEEVKEEAAAAAGTAEKAAEEVRKTVKDDESRKDCCEKSCREEYGSGSYFPSVSRQGYPACGPDEAGARDLDRRTWEERE